MVVYQRFRINLYIVLYYREINDQNSSFLVQCMNVACDILLCL